MMFCIHCGSPIGDDAKFCPKCGAAVNNQPVNNEPSPVPDAIPEVEPSSIPEAMPDIESTPIPEIIPEIEPTPIPEAMPEIEPTPIPEAMPEIEPTPIPEAIPEIDPTPIPEVIPEIEPTPIPEAIPEIEPTPIPEAIPEIDPAPIPEVMPEIEPTPIPEYVPNPAPMPEFVPEPSPEPAPFPAPEYVPQPAEEERSPKKQKKQKKQEKQNKQKKKSSPGVVILSVFLCILLFVFALASSVVGISRNVLSNDFAEKVTENIISDSGNLSETVYEAAKEKLGDNMEHHPELTEKSISDALKAIEKDKSLNDDIKKYLNSYTNYLINGDKLEGIDGDGIIDIIERINDRSTVYNLSDKDREELRNLDFSKTSAITDTIGFNVKYVSFSFSMYSYIALIIISVCFAVLILCANSWRPSALFTYVSMTLTVIGTLFLIAAAGGFIVTLILSDTWYASVVELPVAFVAIRGGAYFLYGLLSFIICRAVRKKKAARTAA